VPEQVTNPTRESERPRTDWDIGKAMNALFVDPAEELEAKEAPVEDKATEDEEVDEVEASGGEEEEPEGDEPSPDSFALPLKVSGKEIVIESRDEAIELAQKGMHYTQEMQQLRREQAQFDSQREALTREVQQQVGQYQTALKTLHATYGYVLGQEAPDWASPEMQRLKAEKPSEYLAAREQWDQLGMIRSELSRIEDEQKQEQQKQWQSWVAKEQAALADKRPEWTDATRRQQDWSLIRDYASQQGISEQEIGSLYDHRFWMILHDAARYRQAESAGKTKAKEAPKSKTVEPGSGKNVNQGNRAFRAERERLRQTGDPRVAGNILQELMTRKK
jgi:hypothetical protein